MAVMLTFELEKKNKIKKGKVWNKFEEGEQFLCFHNKCLCIYISV